MTTPQPDTPATPSPGGTGRPEPVLGAAAAASALTSLAGVVLLVLTLTHVLTPDGQAVLGPALAAAIPTAVGAVSTVLAALHARGKVTPLSAPLSAAGVQLVEVGTELATAYRTATRPPGRQAPGKADHAAPEDTGPTGG